MKNIVGYSHSLFRGLSIFLSFRTIIVLMVGIQHSNLILASEDLKNQDAIYQSLLGKVAEVYSMMKFAHISESNPYFDHFREIAKQQRMLVHQLPKTTDDQRFENYRNLLDRTARLIHSPQATSLVDKQELDTLQNILIADQRVRSSIAVAIRGQDAE